MLHRSYIVAILVLGIFGEALAQDEQQNVSAHFTVLPDEIKWQPIPPSWTNGPPPAGYTLGHSEVAIIQGDPTKAGAPFVIRIRSTPGTQIPPHWHETDELVTVLSGTWCVGMGSKLDANTCKDMPAGSFILLPKGMRHFAVAKGDVVQVHGVGPFRIYFVR